MNRVRIGIIGAGRIGNVMANAYQSVPEAELVAVADVVRPVAETFAKKFDVSAVFESHADLLKSGNVDAVVICAPTFLHEEISIAAAKAGKHIFCQKPMALTVEACEAITAAAEEAKVTLQTGFMLRFTPPFADVKEAISSGEIGTLIALRSSVFGWEPSADWFYDPAKGGGVLIDTIIHTLDLFRWYAGEVETLFASGGAYVLEGAKRHGTPDNIMCSLRFRNGAMGDLYGSWTTGFGDKTLEVYGTNGSVFVDLVGKQGGHIFIRKHMAGSSRPEGWSNLGILWKYGYLGEANHFIKSVLGKVEPQATGRDAIEAQRLAILADHSIRTGEVARIPSPGGQS
ncbi:MAG TPA: Gfo/Idh/MocA family oxidoreductase [Chthoniobacterales bacterium]|nr:Gfo/Idh/MocA family oxidoreductase [Chthoniobacterales bacterium]